MTQHHYLWKPLNNMIRQHQQIGLSIFGDFKIRYFILLSLLIIFCQHLTLLRIAGYEFTLLQLILPLWFFRYFRIKKDLTKKSLMWYIFFVIYPLFNFLTFYSILEFLKTYLQFVLCITFFLLVYNSNINIKKSQLLKTFKIAQIILFILIISQYFLVVKLGQEWFYNPWGSYNSYKYALNRFDYAGYNMFRMKGFFLEPSYAAFVAIAIYVCRYILEQKFLFKSLAITLITLLLIKSSFGFLAFPIITSIIFFKSVPKRYIFIGLFTILVIGVIVGNTFNNTFIELTKLDKFEVEGYTSAYTRWIFPYSLTKHLLENGYYFGYGMGQLDPIIHNFDEIIIDSGEEGVSNSFFLVIIYFGLSSILLFVYLVYNIFRRTNFSKKIILIFILICLTNTGAFNTIEFFSIAIVLPYICYKVRNADDIYNYSYAE